jgi:hypothetical protein
MNIRLHAFGHEFLADGINHPVFLGDQLIAG